MKTFIAIALLFGLLYVVNAKPQFSAEDESDENSQESDEYVNPFDDVKNTPENKLFLKPILALLAGLGIFSAAGGLGNLGSTSTSTTSTTTTTTTPAPGGAPVPPAGGR